jgi:hypothetical protein
MKRGRELKWLYAGGGPLMTTQRSYRLALAAVAFAVIVACCYAALPH